MSTDVDKISKTNINYEKWNEILCEHFFCENNRKKIVYLYVNENLIEKLGGELGLDEEQAMESFCQSVRSYGRKDPNLVFEKAFIWGRKWFNQGMFGYPPFIAVLALTVLAATKMKPNREKGIGSGNYYIRLRNLISIDGEGKPYFFEKQVDLWKYLLTWQKENKGEFGFTNAFQYGQAYIGYPKSQCLIRDIDREQLYEFFHWAGLRPGLNLKTDTLSEQLELYLSTKVSRLSKRFFNNKKGNREAIIKATLIEYNNWNGLGSNKANGIPIFENKRSKKTYNLFLRIDEVKEINFFSPKMLIRYFTIIDDYSLFDEYLDEANFNGFYFKNNSLSMEVNFEDNQITKSQNFNLIDNRLELAFKGGDLFFFQRGTDIGINGWINRDSIVIGKDHLLLFKRDKEKNIGEWIIKNNFPHKEIFFSNLPNSWKCLLVKIIGNEIEFTRELEKYFVLIKNHEKITFQDGLKVGDMEWLLDAPPIISIISHPKTTVYINDQPAFCLINGEDSINLIYLQFNKSRIYRFRINNIEKTILLKNNHENLISFSGYQPKVYSGILKIAGTYIYDNLDTFPRPYKQMGFKAFLTTDNSHVTKYVPKSVNAMPFDINRTYKDIGVCFKNDHTLQVRPIDLFFEYLTIRKQGNWDAYLRGIEWCFGSDKIHLVAYKIRQKLSQLGFVEFTRDKDSNKYFWNVIPTSIAVIPSNDPLVYLTGGRTRESINQLKALSEGKVMFLNSIPNSSFEPESLYLLGNTVNSLKDFFNRINIKYNWGLDYFSYDLLRCLPVLSSYITNALEIQEPRSNNKYWTVEGWDTIRHKWIKDIQSNLKLYKNSFGQFICLYKTSNNKTIKIDRGIGKLYFAQQNGLKIFNYKNYELQVKRQYELPELYERVLTSCVGQCPVEDSGYRIYRNVPHEIAIAVAYKLGFELNFIS